MAVITREKIEQAIKHPDPAKKCLALSSIALQIGCTRMQLWEWCQHEKLTWLVLPGQVDHGVIARYIELGAAVPSDISRGISSKNCFVPAKVVADYMDSHGLTFPEAAGVRPTRNSRARKVISFFWPARVHMGWKEFGRKTNERRKYEALRAA